MENDHLDLRSLFSAVSQLERAYASAPADDLARDGCIQRFEYTFELCRKMLRRQLELMGMEDAARMTIKDLYHEAADAGLIKDSKRWFRYQEARNITSHVYDESKAEKVYLQGAEFVGDARLLLNELLDRHA